MQVHFKYGLRGVKMSYSIIGIIAIIIHLIINKENLAAIFKKDIDKTKKIYGYFLSGILLYYITDSLWGILHEQNLTKLLYADTVIYYVAMSLAVVLWSEYVVAYQEQYNRYGNSLKAAGRMFMLFEVIALIVNMHFPIFFSFDESGTYQAGFIRYIALYIQISLFLFTAVQSFYVAQRLTVKKRRRYMTICVLGIAMTAAIVAQIEFPLLPIYTIGYLFGTCVLHIYVEEDEKEENFTILEHHANIVSSMANMFISSYYIDMKDKSFIKIGNQVKEVEFVVGDKGDAVEKLNQMCRYLILPQYIAEMKEFTDLSTLDLRMREKQHISIQFEGVHTGWVEGYFIAGDRDENGHLKHVAIAMRSIIDQKEKENELRYNSYIDELTRLYNRKMYAEDISEIEKAPLKENFIFISMDINGLKTINDTKGHAAGDELINGAALCMKECFEPYGRVYRTGGDEFIAIIYANKTLLNRIMETFERKTYDFSGKFVEHISVSCGIVLGNDCSDMSISEIEKCADKNMYQQKQTYYQTKGIDRRNR